MIYLDNASTTPCREDSAQIISRAMVEEYFNPSAKYLPAFDMSKKLNEARKQILSLLGVTQSNYSVVFTGSATEANNLVLNSSLSKHHQNLISVGEHASIYETAKKFSEHGFEILEIPLSRNGSIDLDKFKLLMNSKTAFVSVMMVSNETGAINDIKAVTQIAKSINPKVLIHVDAVQAFCKIKINLQELGVDYLTLSAHKVEGPKGVGALIYKSSAKLEPHIFGGGQEQGKRSGTENLPSILGFVNSAVELNKNMQNNYVAVQDFKNRLIDCLEKKAGEHGLKFVLNGDKKTASPYILSCGFVGTKGEVLLHALASEGILVGTGSACNSKHSGNRILSAMGRSKEEVECNIRLSFRAETANENPEQIAEKIVYLAKKHNAKK